MYRWSQSSNTLWPSSFTKKRLWLNSPSRGGELECREKEEVLYIRNIEDLGFFFTFMPLVWDLDKVILDLILSQRQHISDIKGTFIQQMGKDVCAHSTIKFSQRHDREIQPDKGNTLRLNEGVSSAWTLLSISCSHFKACNFKGMKCFLQSFSAWRMKLSGRGFPQESSISATSHIPQHTHTCSNTHLY